MIPKVISFVDVETTGGSPTADRIIDIGILRVVDGKLEETYETLIDPQSYLPPEITRLTGISSFELEGAPTFRQEKDRIDELLKDSVVIAHNARFDTGFLKAEYARTGERFSFKHLCSAKLSRLLFPRFRHHNLDSIIERFELECEPRHRAFPDAKVLWDFFQKLLAGHDRSLLEQAVAKLLRGPALPKGIHEKHIDNLPEKPGVYIFYGEKGTPLYVGKSVNIHTRVLSHFYSDFKSTKEFSMSQQVVDIEPRETAGELEALLLEKRLVLEMQPLYNRQLRDNDKLLVALATQNPKGYDTIKLVQSSEIDFGNIPNILVTFLTMGKAKRTLTNLAKDHCLCQKLLGLERTKGECFGTQIETCKGACGGREQALIYNLRFQEAFAKTKVKQWPFAGPIMISEGSKGHVVYQWCYLGLAEGENDISNLMPEPQFNYDTYKILSNYLLRPDKKLRIKNIQLEFEGKANAFSSPWEDVSQLPSS